MTKRRAPPPKRPSVLDSDLYGAQGSFPLAGRPLDAPEQASAPTLEVTWAQFERHLSELTKEIRRAFQPDIVIGLGINAKHLGEGIAEAFGVPYAPVPSIRGTSPEVPQSRVMRLAEKARHAQSAEQEFATLVRGKKVLLANDAVGSGVTFEIAQNLVRVAGATELRTAALISKPGAPSLDFIGIVTADYYVFPWDLEPFSPGTPAALTPEAKPASRSAAATKKKVRSR